MKRRQSGMSLMEVLAALAILSTLIFATVTVSMTAIKGAKNNMDKQFATQKAISMLEELKALVQSREVAGSASVILERFDDGVVFNDALTTETDPVTNLALLPANPISGNTATRGASPGWLYTRRIQVRPLSGVQSNDVRLVSVAVFKNDPGGGQPRLLAEVTGVLRTLAQDMPPTQVYDVFCIAIENVPGWWVYMNNLIPFVQGAVNNLQIRNPGLVFRTHWITKLSYGRDQRYKPYVNMATPSTDPINWVYFYPGTMPGGSATAAYYPPLNFRGRINIDNVVATNPANGYAVTLPADGGPLPTDNPAPYALADQYNHAMRYEDELALYNVRLANNPGEERTLRLLYEDMHLNPQNHVNSIIINLHGELMPFPPIRNYSDAAKAPAVTIGGQSLANVRVVTHPERMWLNTANDPATLLPPPMRLRVYSYRTDIGPPDPLFGADPASYTGLQTNWLGESTGTPVPITITLPGVNWSAVAGANIQRIQGGFAGQVGGADYTVSNAPLGYVANSMTYEKRVDFDAMTGAPTTVISLFNSPLKCPLYDPPAAGSDREGLRPTGRLYGLEYVPSPVEDVAAGQIAFTAGLQTSETTATGDDDPKNTARWIISVPEDVLPDDRVIRIETRIGTDLTTGRMYPAPNQPENYSSTFVWRGTQDWAFSNPAAAPPVLTAAFPITERFQIIGDPRHVPYLDTKMGHLGSGATVTGPLGGGFNRYHDDMSADPLDVNADGDTNDTEQETQGNQRQKWRGWYYTNAAVTAFYGVKNATAAPPGASAWINFINNDGWDTRNAKDALPGTDLAAATMTTTVAMPTSIPGTPRPDYGGGMIELDVPRIFQIVRTAILPTNSVWTTMTGFSYYYLGIGNEIGYDSANGFANSIPVSARPFRGDNTANWFEQSIINDNPGPCNAVGGVDCWGGVKYIAEDVARGWWGISWLGEIYPDSQFANWVTNGNLATGAGAGTFRRVMRQNVWTRTAGTRLINGVHRTRNEGSPTFFSAGASQAATFHHRPTADDTTATLQTEGTEISAKFNFPEVNPIPNNRPFLLSTGDGTVQAPNGFLESQYGGAKTLASIAQFYKHTNNDDGSTLVALRDNASADAAFVVVNGLSPTGASGTSFIARWSFLSLIHSYLRSGIYDNDANVATVNLDRTYQLPQIAITEPNVRTNLRNATSIRVEWSRLWRRWDGQKYTDAYADTFAETMPVWYYVMYSRDNGDTWLYARNDTAATPGTTPADPVLNAAVRQNTLTYDWNTPAATYPEGTYLIRVEAYRQLTAGPPVTLYPLHYSLHQVRIFIRRTS